jgi:aldose 1-epimerase
MNVPLIEAKLSVKKENFGKTNDGKKVELYTLTNSKGSEAKIITFGGTLVSLKVPDKTGKFGDVVLGFDTIADYEKHNAYFGALIGRYANRIEKARFTLNGKTYNLTKNNGENNLHGGPKGFNRVIWTAKSSTNKNGANLLLTYFSKDGEEGFPANLTVKVTYSLTENDELKIIYSATADNDTIVNLTQHSYFNLAGSGEILHHWLTINADKFTPIDANSIPFGELKSVKNTPFDFTDSTKIGDKINLDDEQLKNGKGYDHNWVLQKKGAELSLAAKVFEEISGREMEVWTTEPGLQFYSGNFLDEVKGKYGNIYTHQTGFCLEAQNFPDSPNKKNFPSPILKKGRTYRQTTIYKFSLI